ncbi:MAG: FMN-binding protein [Bacteroidia bacterium]|nr:FMN-binding protein [Bacteroidia bacterium]
MKIFSFSALWLSTSLALASVFVLPLSQKAEKEINKTFDVTQTTLNLVLTQDYEGIGHEHFFRVLHEEKLLGYAYFGEAPSKTDTFEYLVVFDVNFKVKKTKVLVYKEDYGGEIGSKRWLKQFTDKSPKNRFEYRQNIAAISGATISVKSMTEAMNNLMISLDSWRNNGEPHKK